MESEGSGTVQYQEFIKVDVGSPELAINGGDKLEKYIVYPMTVRTNSLSFAAPHTRVYRRYKDFLWLYRRLKSIHIADARSSVPSLPRRQLPFWNFEEAFLESRRKSLETFLGRVVLETVFLSSSSVHLFLQTQLSPNEMESMIESGNVETAINSNLQIVKVDQDFMDSLESSGESYPASSDQDSEGNDSLNCDDPVFWRCEKNTLKKVASLPHFTPLLKQYESLFTDDAESLEKTNLP